jgi:ubiquinone/menaquinone biosynthesis C-methylase UbiE
MNAQIDNQYSTGLSRSRIEQALIAAGKDLNHLEPDDLAELEDFHTLGRIATGQLADLAQITKDDDVLDAGSGIGGTARFLAGHYGCAVTAIDLTEEYCEIARWLNQLVGLDRRISVRAGDVTYLPFDPASFTAVFSQHVQMNVADKARLYQEARRVLVTDGRLAVWDVTSGVPGKLDYPVPWADQPDLSHLVTADELRAEIEAAGFAITHWADLTEQAATFMRIWLSAAPGPLGLHTFVDNFAQKAGNLVDALTSRRLRVIQGIARASA